MKVFELLTEAAKRDKGWDKWKARISIAYQSEVSDKGVNKDALDKTYEKAEAEFKRLKQKHKDKFWFASEKEAIAYMKTMEYPGWPIKVEVTPEYKYGNYYPRFAKTRREKVVLEPVEFKAAFKASDIKVEDIGDGKVKVSCEADKGKIISVIRAVGLYAKIDHKLEAFMKSGKAFDFSSFKSNTVIIKGPLATVKKIVDEQIEAHLGYDKDAHEKSMSAIERKAEASKFSAELQKERKEELYKKYGKDIVDRVKIKSLIQDGDDGYQWSLWVDGRRIKSGLTQSQAQYEQKAQWKWLKLQRDDPEEFKKEVELGKAVQMYFHLDRMEKAVKSATTDYLGKVNKNAKDIVDSEKAAKDAIDKAKGKKK